MLYAIFCYDDEDMVFARDDAENQAIMDRLHAVEDKLAQQGRLGPVARLLPTTAATSVKKGAEPLVIDGPFAETKEALLGFFIVDCEDLEAAIAVTKELAEANPGKGGYEVRPLLLFKPRELTG